MKARKVGFCATFVKYDCCPVANADTHVDGAVCDDNVAEPPVDELNAEEEQEEAAVPACLAFRLPANAVRIFGPLRHPLSRSCLV